jgi:hypothetical protein
MSSSIGGTERYTGGAKERAQDNRANGTGVIASVLLGPMLRHVLAYSS